MQRYSSSFQDVLGDAIPGATISVFTAGTTTPATIYATNVAANPLASLTSDASTGTFSFYAADGRYDIQAVKTGYTTQTLRDQLLYDPAASTGAAGVGFSPHGNLSSATVQAALAEEVDDLAASSGASLVGFVSSGTSAVARTLQDVERAVIRSGDYDTRGHTNTAARLLTEQLNVADLSVISSCFSGFKPSNTRKLRNGLARVRAGTGNLTIACLGDSTFAGVGANTGTGGVAGALAYTVPVKLASILDKRLAKSINGAVWGTNTDQSVAGTVPYNTYDPRLSPGAGWAVDLNPGSSIGGMWANSTTTNALAFTPPDAFDSIDVYYATNGGLGTFTINVDGGATLATVVTSAASGLGKTSVTCALATHTLNVARSAGGTCYIIGMVTYDSTNPAIRVWQWGVGSTAASYWAATGNPWSTGNAIATIAPDVVIYGIGINDVGGVIATFKTNVQTAITKALVAGDVIIAIPDPTDTASQTQANQDAIREALYDVANTNNLPVIDRNAALESYTQLVANGWNFDSLHLNKFGYADVASLFAKALMSAVG